MTSSSSIVPVGLGARSYDIHIGEALLPMAGNLIRPLLKRPRAAIVTDTNVAPLHLPILEAALDKANIHRDVITLPAGESTKDFSHLEILLEELINLEIERSDIIIALGGGVIGDITGFAAAILRRGCRFVQIPTTLLAQVDSSVGGKTAINSRKGKNLIGAFHQPDLVIADIDVLTSLPDRQMRAGYAEVIKYGLLGDLAFFEWLEGNGSKIFAGDKTALSEAVRQSCAAKARIVAEDETEKGVRALLNLGHTFGHAFEAVTGYSDQLFHGEGVSIGMALAFDFSVHLGLCSGQDAARAKAHLAASGLPVKPQDIDSLATDADTLVKIMYQDKKVSDGNLTFILARGIGDAFIDPNVNPDTLKSFLTSVV